MPGCWILFLFFLSQIFFHFLLSACAPRFPWDHLGSFLHFYIINFLDNDSSSSSSRYLQSNQITSLSALEKIKRFEFWWVFLFPYLCFLNLFGGVHDWKSRFPSWWIPQLWAFLRFTGQGAGPPWLDHDFSKKSWTTGYIQVSPNLVFYDCMILVPNAKVVLNPIFYWQNSMIPLAHSPTKTGELIVFCLLTVFSMYFINSSFIFVCPCKYSNRPASHFDRTTQDAPLLYNNFPLEHPFELCQLQSSWSVLYILNYWYSAPRLTFWSDSLSSTATNNTFSPSFLCLCLALFNHLHPLFAQPRCQPLSAEEFVKSRAGMGADSSAFQHQILKLY